MVKAKWVTNSGLLDTDINETFYRYAFHPDLPTATPEMHRLNGEIVVQYAKMEQTGHQTVFRVYDLSTHTRIEVSSSQLYPLIGKKAKMNGQEIHIVDIFTSGDVLVDTGNQLKTVSHTQIQCVRADWEKNIQHRCKCSIETLVSTGCTCGGV